LLTRPRQRPGRRLRRSASLVAQVLPRILPNEITTRGRLGLWCRRAAFQSLTLQPSPKLFLGVGHLVVLVDNVRLRRESARSGFLRFLLPTLFQDFDVPTTDRALTIFSQLDAISRTHGAEQFAERGVEVL